MSPKGTDKSAYLNGFPRVSGDEPPLPRLTEASTAFSPRERG